MAGTFAFCRYCNKQIIWIKTTKGKNMPVDPGIKPFWRDDEGTERLVTYEGEVVRCSLDNPGRDADDVGYTPHFSTCTKYPRHQGKKERKARA